MSQFVGQRDLVSATDFMQDVASRLANRVQLTTDGHRPYLQAVENAFDDRLSYASKCIGAECNIVHGRPEEKHISTSYVERQNLPMRMQMRRFTRLTNASLRN